MVLEEQRRTWLNTWISVLSMRHQCALYYKTKTLKRNLEGISAPPKLHLTQTTETKMVFTEYKTLDSNAVHLLLPLYYVYVLRFREELVEADFLHCGTGQLSQHFLI